MERLVRIFSEIRKQLRPQYVVDFESQANRFITGITFGAKEEWLFKAKDKGLCLYHHGPEIKVVPGFPFNTEKPTGKEYVFFEYLDGRIAYHFVGSIDKLRRFTLVQLDSYTKGAGYCQVPMKKYRRVICKVTEMLREMELT